MDKYLKWRNQPTKIVEGGTPTSKGDKIGICILIVVSLVCAYLRLKGIL